MRSPYHMSLVGITIAGLFLAIETFHRGNPCRKCYRGVSVNRGNLAQPGKLTGKLELK